MKNLILLLGILITPFLASASYSLDDGKYYNHAIEKKVRINCTGSSIKAKGLINYDWTKFRSRGHREFVDRRGNTIRVVGKNTFEFRARGRNRVLTFHRDRFVERLEHEIFDNGCNSYCSSNCNLHHGHGSQGSHGGQQNDHGYSSGGYVDGQGLEGVWATSRFDRDVIVERTNEGIRAKLIGSNKDWTYYRQDSYDKKEYVDNRGNRYVVRSSRELVWYQKQGGSPIVLSRIR